jgi:hypothetical protein
LAAVPTIGTALAEKSAAELLVLDSACLSPERAPAAFPEQPSGIRIWDVHRLLPPVDLITLFEHLTI